MEPLDPDVERELERIVEEAERRHRLRAPHPT